MQREGKHNTDNEQFTDKVVDLLFSDKVVSDGVRPKIEEWLVDEADSTHVDARLEEQFSEIKNRITSRKKPQKLWPQRAKRPGKETFPFKQRAQPPIKRPGFGMTAVAPPMLTTAGIFAYVKTTHVPSPVGNH